MRTVTNDEYFSMKTFLYYSVLVLPFLLTFVGILISNFIVPYFKKKKLYQQIQDRDDWAIIHNTEAQLKTLYKGVHAKMLSMIHRSLRMISNKEFVYGEIDFLSFFTILEKARPKSGDVFYDLGSGSGKAVFTAAMFFDLSKSCGIELLLPLHNKAMDQLKKATSVLKIEKKRPEIQFIKGDFFDIDYNDANIIYIAATCLSDETWKKLIHKMSTLKPGTRIIVATKSIQHEKFQKIYQCVDLMSWGLCPVKIYKIKAGV